MISEKTTPYEKSPWVMTERNWLKVNNNVHKKRIKNVFFHPQRDKAQREEYYDSGELSCLLWYDTGAMEKYEGYPANQFERENYPFFVTRLETFYDYPILFRKNHYPLLCAPGRPLFD